jgi:hypothetical protein
MYWQDQETSETMIKWITLAMSAGLLGLFIYLALHPTVIQDNSMWLAMPKTWRPPAEPPPVWYTQPAWWGVILAGLNMALGVFWKVMGK